MQRQMYRLGETQDLSINNRSWNGGETHEVSINNQSLDGSHELGGFFHKGRNSGAVVCNHEVCKIESNAFLIYQGYEHNVMRMVKKGV